MNEGDYLLKVNGKEVFADRNIYSYFLDLADKQITITVNDKPSLDGAKEYVVKTLSMMNLFTLPELGGDQQKNC